MFALQEAERLNHTERDLLNAYNLQVIRAKVLAWLGYKDAAVDLLGSLLQKAGPGLSPIEVKDRLDWWPLRGNPRFNALRHAALQPDRPAFLCRGQVQALKPGERRYPRKKSIWANGNGTRAAALMLNVRSPA